MTTYRLGSSGLVGAPGLIAWAINGYAFKRDQKAMLNVVTQTWSIPEAAAKALLSKTAPYTLDGDVVVFTVEDAA
ncbi:hypothetical protein [Mesorhizobium sp. M0767]|uniref:hypothetical protein n=1 Tax=Mesorhizobium sp. M0767 TaxID=2956995 RepID=UPI003338DB99